METASEMEKVSSRDRRQAEQQRRSRNGEQGSEKLLQLVSDGSGPTKETESDCGASKDGGGEMLEPLWVLHPSKELEKLLSHSNGRNGPSDCVLLDICKTFHLNAHDVSKYGKKSIQRKNLDTE